MDTSTRDRLTTDYDVLGVIRGRLEGLEITSIGHRGVPRSVRKRYKETRETMVRE